MREFTETAAALTPETYAAFKLAVELGKWPDGQRLSAEQRAICLQAMIAYERRHLPETEWTGYMPPQHCKSEDKTPENLIFRGDASLH